MYFFYDSICTSYYEMFTGNTRVVLVHRNVYERNRKVANAYLSLCVFKVGCRGLSQQPDAESTARVQGIKKVRSKDFSIQACHSPGFHSFSSPPIGEFLLSTLFRPCFFASTNDSGVQIIVDFHYSQ